MSDYRLYVLNDEGHFLGRIDLDCTDDQHAHLAATAYLDGHDAELWQGRRRVGVLPRPKGQEPDNRPRGVAGSLGQFWVRHLPVTHAAWRWLKRRRHDSRTRLSTLPAPRG